MAKPTEEPSEAKKEVIRGFVESIEAKHEKCGTLDMNRYGFGAWSISKLKVLQKCPLNFYLKYVLKVPVPEGAGREDSLSADVGSAGHRILEHMMLGVAKPQAYALTKAEYCPEKITEQQWEDLVVSLETQIISFKERMDAFVKRNHVHKIFTEVRLAVTKEWDPCHFFDGKAYFRGVIDLCLLLENNDLIIIDHKTGGGDGGIRPYKAQLNSYKPLFHFGHSKINGAQSGVHFIRAQDIQMDFYSSVKDIENKHIQELEWAFDGAVDRVKELGFFKHVAGPYCAWCDYAVACKAKDKPLKQLELSTKKVIPIKAI